MATVGTIAGVVGLLLAVGAAVWYKYRADSSSAVSDVAQANSALEEQKRLAQEAQAAAKTASERAQLDAEIASIQGEKDDQVRTQRALELLARIRGVR